MDAHNGVMLKNTLQESDLKVSEEQVESLKENKKSNSISLTGTGKDDLGITRIFGISEQSNGNMRLLIIQEGKELKRTM